MNGIDGINSTVCIFSILHSNSLHFSHRCVRFSIVWNRAGRAMHVMSMIRRIAHTQYYTRFTMNAAYTIQSNGERPDCREHAQFFFSHAITFWLLSPQQTENDSRKRKTRLQWHDLIACMNRPNWNNTPTRTGDGEHMIRDNSVSIVSFTFSELQPHIHDSSRFNHFCFCSSNPHIELN